jgi:polar amino acid transport system substrate-binding protein
MKLEVILSAVVMTLLATTAEAADAGPFSKAGKIEFCTELGDPPAAFVKDDGVTPAGFEVDLMNAIGDAMGVKTELKNFKFSSIFAAMDSGQCDAVMSQTTKNPERQQKYGFVDYRQQSSGFLVPVGKPNPIRTYDDTSGRRVGVLLGSSNEKRLVDTNAKLVADGKPPMTIATYQTNAVAFRELQLGRIDALASGSLVLAYFAGQSGGKFEIGGLPVAPNTLGIVIPKAETEKVKAIQAAFDETVKTGKAQEIVDTWKVSSGTTICGPAHACD